MTAAPPWDPVPDRLLYEQLADHLAARIASGDFAPGDRFPAEQDLADQYGVAYHTVRNALKVLRERGLVVTLRGRGTYVPTTQHEPPAR